MLISSMRLRGHGQRAAREHVKWGREWREREWKVVGEGENDWEESESEKKMLKRN
jgi:hypothetical protein